MDAAIILRGGNLGERHHCLNQLVDEYCQKKRNFNSLCEATPIDKIFKIDVANQNKHVDYIIQTLKDDDLLYVCRALKSHWLISLEFINPVYLETKLFPEMTKPAVIKMKHWIKANLKNPQRCEEFYTYYKNNFEESIKYLKHCTVPVILSEVVNIIEKLTPRHLKVLCLVCPNVSKVYYEHMLKNDNAIKNYRKYESEFLDSLKCILKLDGDLYLELIETYYTKGPLSPSATQYIMKKFKNKYLSKPELYTSQILDVKTLALCLTSNECRELVFQLAKAEYLQGWFSYTSVQPFIKKLPVDERATVKKQVFIDKAVGEKVKKWPYNIPTCPNVINNTDHIFDDEKYHNYEYSCYDEEDCIRMPMMCKKRKFIKYQSMCMSSVVKRKTPLDQLYNKYRFAGFSKTYAELKNQLQAESTLEGRQNILLVLISKTGGVLEYVQTLMKLLTENHKNEPSNLRATIVRSLVKRLDYWRMPEDNWCSMLVFGHGLGLDGRDGNPLCIEGLHAVILRSILNGTTPTVDILKAYHNNFTTFKEYALKGSEIMQLKKYLPSMIQEWPLEFVDVVSTYNIKDIADLEDNLAKSAVGNLDLINTLFEKRIARRQLITDTFPIKQFEASYINALRHDPSLLGDGEIFASLALKEKTNHKRFLLNLKIYFGETAGLADQHLVALNNAFNIKPKSSLVRPIAMLSRNYCIIKQIEELRKDKSKANLKLTLAFQDNIHLCKPHINIDINNWQILGFKALGNQILNSKNCLLERNIQSCLKHRGSMALALRLALNTDLEEATFSFAAVKRPKVAIKVAVSHHFIGSLNMPLEIWKIIKEIILRFDYEKLPRKVLEHLKHKGQIPKNIEADYWATVHQALIRVNKKKAIHSLYKMVNMLNKVNKDIVRQIVDEFIKHNITVENFTNYDNLDMCGIEYEKPSDVINNTFMCLYMRIIAKYLLLATNSEEQCEIIKNTVSPFLDNIEKIWRAMEDKSYIINCLDEFLKSLKYTSVFIDKQYVSCIPVFTTIISRLSNFMLRKEYFNQYTKIHFTILYHNAIQYALKQNPQCFDSEDKTEVMNIVGTEFGKYVGLGITELSNEYFISIIEIYNEGLKDFFTEYIPYRQCRFNFIATVTKGILKVDTLEAYLVAVYLYKVFKNSWGNSKDIAESLGSCQYQEVKLYLNDSLADLGSFYYY